LISSSDTSVALEEPRIKQTLRKMMLENKYKVKCKNSMNKSNFKVDVVQHKHILRANDNIRKYKKVKKVT